MLRRFLRAIARVSWTLLLAVALGMPTSPGQEAAVGIPGTDYANNSDSFSGPQISDSGVGYIDSAILSDLVRLRFDSAYNNPQPARAEFVWPIDGPFGPGPGPETRVDYQDFRLYAERVFAPRWSAFAELPFRLLNGELQDNTAGMGDVNAGFKFELASSCQDVLTLQFRTYAPTGSGTRGLGTRHASVEPALLWWHRHSDRLTVEGEVQAWSAIGGSEGFAGDVLRYGLGSSYLLNPESCHPLYGVAEFVGWTVLNGGTAITTSPTNTLFTDATGDTIVNVKVGLRWQLNCSDSLYAGYGRALTEQSWYEDVLRVEFRRAF